MAKRNIYGDANSFAPEIRARGKRSKGAEEPPAPQRMKMRLQGMDAYSRHKQLINNYVLFHTGSTSKLQRDTSKDRNDFDIIKENHRFLWEGKDLTEAEQSWEKSLARKYYDKLFKEYCIADLSQYKRNLVAMRWRVEREVFSGKGQFECGNKHCTSREDLSSWEVNFAYQEAGQKKNALVKLRLCPACSEKLNFHSKKRLIKKEKKASKGLKPKKRSHRASASPSSSTSSASGDESEAQGPSTTASLATVKEEGPSAETTEKRPGGSKEAERNAGEIWARKTAVEDAEKTLEDEFDEFIDDLLL